MSCSCMIGYDADEYNTLYTEGYPRARKSHVCVECRREIVRGEVYERIKALFDGVWTTTKTCADCMSVRRALFCNWVPGEVWDDVQRTFSHKLPPAECMMQMTKPARDKVCDIIESGWEKEQTCQ